MIKIKLTYKSLDYDSAQGQEDFTLEQFYEDCKEVYNVIFQEQFEFSKEEIANDFDLICELCKNKNYGIDYAEEVNNRYISKIECWLDDAHKVAHYDKEGVADYD